MRRKRIQAPPPTNVDRLKEALSKKPLTKAELCDAAKVRESSFVKTLARARDLLKEDGLNVVVAQIQLPGEALSQWRYWLERDNVVSEILRENIFSMSAAVAPKRGVRGKSKKRRKR